MNKIFAIQLICYLTGKTICNLNTEDWFCFRDTWNSDTDFICHKVPTGDLDCELAVDRDPDTDQPPLKCCDQSNRSECNIKHTIAQFEVAETKCRFDCCPEACVNIKNPIGLRIWIVVDSSDLTKKDCKRLCGTP